MNGIDMIRFVRDHPSYRNFPIMVLSSRGDEDARRRALELGADDYVAKPFVPLAFCH